MLLTNKSLNHYFDKYDQYFSLMTEYEYPLIYREYDKIKKEAYYLVDQISSENFFSKLKQLLILDARIQIIQSLLELESEKTTEAEILELAKTDSWTFYKEAAGYRLNETVPHTLLNYVLAEDEGSRD